MSGFSKKQIDKICDLYEKWIIANEGSDLIADEIDELLSKVGFIENLQISQELKKKGLPALPIIMGHHRTLDRSARETLRQIYNEKGGVKIGVQIPLPIKIEEKKKRRKKQEKAPIIVSGGARDMDTKSNFN